MRLRRVLLTLERVHFFPDLLLLLFVCLFCFFLVFFLFNLYMEFILPTKVLKRMGMILASSPLLVS